MKQIDARGLACPQPVILAKKALETDPVVEITVDNRTAVENVTRLAQSQKCSVNVAERNDGAFTLRIEKNSGGEKRAESLDGPAVSTLYKGLIVVLSEDRLGRGSDELGRVLIRSFLHTLTETVPLPEKIICYNTGVKLAAEESDVLDDLGDLQKKGVDVLVCGTCLNYFGLSDKLKVGKVSNMYDIATLLVNASRMVCP